MSIDQAIKHGLAALVSAYKESFAGAPGMPSDDVLQQQLFQQIQNPVGSKSLGLTLDDRCISGIKPSVLMASLSENIAALNTRRMLADSKNEADQLYLGAVEYHAKARATRSTNGIKGANTKHAATRELKEWALEKASTMRGSDGQIAGKLMKELPDHLKDASTDPKRFIWDHLRESKKSLI